MPDLVHFITRLKIAQKLKEDATKCKEVNYFRSRIRGRPVDDYSLPNYY